MINMIQKTFFELQALNIHVMNVYVIDVCN